MASALYVFLLLVTAGASASLAEDAACAHGSTCTAGADEPAEDGAAMLQLPAAGPSLYEANTTVDVKLHKPQLDGTQCQCSYDNQGSKSGRMGTFYGWNNVPTYGCLNYNKLCSTCTCGDFGAGQFGSCADGNSWSYGCCGSKNGQLCNSCPCNGGGHGLVGFCRVSRGGSPVQWGCCGSKDGTLCDR
mmetsp:Transcript_50277/g.144647  ORF Transcript_50277/g.144647 Transcript_50277/m.144647 type:complete len:188 (+) Transcript_50277:88-651(+)